jgi:hypothetical protein
MKAKLHATITLLLEKDAKIPKGYEFGWEPQEFACRESNPFSFVLHSKICAFFSDFAILVQSK